MRSFSYARTTLLAFAVVLTGITSADAFEQKKFDPKSFKAAQDSNKSILVDVVSSLQEAAPGLGGTRQEA